MRVLKESRNILFTQYIYNYFITYHMKTLYTLIKIKNRYKLKLVHSKTFINQKLLARMAGVLSVMPQVGSLTHCRQPSRHTRVKNRVVPVQNRNNRFWIPTIGRAAQNRNHRFLIPIILNVLMHFCRA